jgi:hypothetical protein
MNHRDLVKVTLTEKDTIIWMQQNGYLHNEWYCLICNRIMKQVLKKGVHFFVAPSVEMNGQYFLIVFLSVQK